MELKLVRLQETETEKGLSGSATFDGETAGLLNVSFTLRGDKAAVDGWLKQLDASVLDRVIEITITPSKQSRL